MMDSLCECVITVMALCEMSVRKVKARLLLGTKGHDGESHSRQICRGRQKEWTNKTLSRTTRFKCYLKVAKVTVV